MIDVYIVGEDRVTRSVLQRIIKLYAPNLNIVQSIPARGGEIKSKIVAFNKLAESFPVILLEDLDTEPCPPIAKANLLRDVQELSPDFIISIAVDEAEAWLFADREGFSSYFEVPLEEVPKAEMHKLQGMKSRSEVLTNVKSSLFLTHQLISLSSNSILRSQIFSSTSCKGKEYNPAILPYIQDKWNPEVARESSYSLDSTIKRICRLNDKYENA